MTALPSLFISHGSPSIALHPGMVGQRLAEIAAELPRPKAIIIASAHWLARRTFVGGASAPDTIHDFGNFPAVLHAMRYLAPGAPDLASRIACMLDESGFATTVDPVRGLDHGAWVPMRLLYPAADIPVLQVSVQLTKGPKHQFALGRALAPLRDEGMLLIGSGSITHNLRDIAGPQHGSEPLPYVAPFTSWIAGKLEANDVDALLDYRNRAPGAVRAHPTDEHLLPLFFAAGAAGERWRTRRIEAGIDFGAVAMDIYRFDSAA
jgi:4,5-DOPA dioxygenase extradiol